MFVNRSVVWLVGFCALTVGVVPVVSAVGHGEAPGAPGVPGPGVGPVSVSVVEEERCMDRSWGERCVRDVVVRVERTEGVRGPVVDEGLVGSASGVVVGVPDGGQSVLCDSSTSCQNVLWSLVPRVDPPKSSGEVAEEVCAYSHEEPGHNLYQSLDCLFSPDVEALPVGVSGGSCGGASVELAGGPWSMARLSWCL